MSKLVEISKHSHETILVDDDALENAPRFVLLELDKVDGFCTYANARDVINMFRRHWFCQHLEDVADDDKYSNMRVMEYLIKFLVERPGDLDENAEA